MELHPHDYLAHWNLELNAFLFLNAGVPLVVLPEEDLQIQDLSQGQAMCASPAVRAFR